MSIRAGAAIVEILTSDETIQRLVGDRVYPILSQEDTKFPYIAYRRKGLTPAYTKTPHKVEDSVYIDIAIVSDKYEESLDVAVVVLSVLEKKRGLFAGIDINEILLADSEEEAGEGYMQRLEFEIFINKLK